jgi:hypothetical protein
MIRYQLLTQEIAMYLYLDESGDLGFDFYNKKPSRFFVITLVQLQEAKSIKIINKAVSKTLKNKINHKKKKRIILELKGSDTRLEIKKYFLAYLDRHISDLKIYAITLDKQALLKQRPNPIKDSAYNQMAHQLIEKINFPRKDHVNLVVDRCKSNLGIEEFNAYLHSNLSLCLDLETKLYITHDNSVNHKGIQAADMFCHGIARKYELNNDDWYNEYKDKILVECKFKA